VTVADTALNTSLSLDEARDLLEDLAARGHCNRTTVRGSVVYVFPDLRNP
jgi:hypothetical protein